LCTPPQTHRGRIAEAGPSGPAARVLRAQADEAVRLRVKTLEGLRVIQRIVALLEQIQDESLLESIYWLVERLVVRQPPED
jgi:hypothetical protein